MVADARYQQVDVTDEEALRRLLAATPGRLIIYFALPSTVMMRACTTLAAIGVPTGTELVLEKPFGTDSDNARAFNKVLAEMVPESQIHRIDHFLGMSTVLNLLGLRFTNRVVTSTQRRPSPRSKFASTKLWRSKAVPPTTTTRRLVDMIQNHLLRSCR